MVEGLVSRRSLLGAGAGLVVATGLTPPDLARLPSLAASITGGADFEALDAGNEADHRGIYVHALLAQKPWFDSLLGNSGNTGP